MRMNIIDEKEVKTDKNALIKKTKQIVRSKHVVQLFSSARKQHEHLSVQHYDHTNISDKLQHISDNTNSRVGQNVPKSINLMQIKKQQLNDMAKLKQLYEYLKQSNKHKIQQVQHNTNKKDGNMSIDLLMRKQTHGALIRLADITFQELEKRLFIMFAICHSITIAEKQLKQIAISNSAHQQDRGRKHDAAKIKSKIHHLLVKHKQALDYICILILIYKQALTVIKYCEIDAITVSQLINKLIALCNSQTKDGHVKELIEFLYGILPAGQ